MTDPTDSPAQPDDESADPSESGVPGKGTQAFAQLVVDQRKAQRTQIKGHRKARVNGALVMGVVAFVVVCLIATVLTFRKRKADRMARALHSAAAPAAQPPQHQNVRWSLRSQPSGAE